MPNKSIRNFVLCLFFDHQNCLLLYQLTISAHVLVDTLTLFFFSLSSFMCILFGYGSQSFFNKKHIAWQTWSTYTITNINSIIIMSCFKVLKDSCWYKKHLIPHINHNIVLRSLINRYSTNARDIHHDLDVFDQEYDKPFFFQVTVFFCKFFKRICLWTWIKFLFNHQLENIQQYSEKRS